MVTCIDELREAKALIAEIKAELDREGIEYNRDIQVGICLLYTSRRYFRQIAILRMITSAVGCCGPSFLTASVTCCAF